MKLKYICIRSWHAPSGETTRLSETTSFSGLSPPQSTLTLLQVSPGNHTLSPFVSKSPFSQRCSLTFFFKIPGNVNINDAFHTFVTFRRQCDIWLNTARKAWGGNMDLGAAQCLPLPRGTTVSGHVFTCAEAGWIIQ